MTFDPHNHYWAIGGSATEVYASNRNIMVPVADPAYQAWLAEFAQDGLQTPINSPTQIADLETLRAVIAPINILPEWLIVTKPTFIQPAEGTYTKEQLIEYSADRRWREELTGINVGGYDVKTERVDQALTATAAGAAKENLTGNYDYKIADGTFVVLTGAQLVSTSVAISNHVQACFTVEKTTHDAITAGIVTTLEQVDAAYDPLAQRDGRKEFATLRTWRRPRG